MTTQQKHTLPGLDYGVRVAWTDNDGQEQEDEVRSWSDKKISTIRGSVRWDAKNLRVLPPTELPAVDAARHTPRDGETRPLPLRKIAPSSLNPRKTFVLETLQGLADSIRETGLIQSLVVRPAKGWHVVPCRSNQIDGWMVQNIGFKTGHWDIQAFYVPHFFANREEAEAYIPEWELIAGERRFRASHLAELKEVECKIRLGLDDPAAYRMMVDENEEREEVNPIDAALSLHQMLAQGVSQRRLAEALGTKSQSKISRMASLVELPEPVKELGRAGKLQASHLERLAKWTARPDLCAAIAEIAAERGASVRDLEKGLPFSDEPAVKKLVTAQFYHTSVEFDFASAQKAHPGAFVPAQYDGWFYCVDKRLFNRLQQEGRQAKAAADAERRAAALDGAGLEPGAHLPEVGSMRNIVQLSQHSRTPSCDCETCPCLVKAWDHWGQKVVLVCSDPKRFQELKEKDDRALAAARAAAAEDAYEQVLAHVRETTEISGRDLLYLTTVAHDSLPEAAKLLGLEVPPCTHETKYLLASIPPLELRRLLLLSQALHERESRIRWSRSVEMERYLGIGPEPSAAAPTAAEAEPWPCQRCGELVNAATVAALDEARGDRTFIQDEADVLLTANSALYCADCAPDVAICRICGCTDEIGCSEGCQWIGDDLCTGCAKKLEQGDRNPVTDVTCYECGAGLDPREGLLYTQRAGRGVHVCEGCKAQELAAVAVGGAS